MAINHFETVGLNRQIVQQLLRDPKGLRSFLKRYRRDMGTVTHSDVSKTILLHEEQSINAAFDTLERCSDAAFLKMGEEYLKETETDSISVRLRLQSALSQTEQLKSDYESQRKNVERRIEAIRSEHDSIIRDLVSVGRILPAHLTGRDDAGVFPDRLIGSSIVSFIKMSKLTTQRSGTRIKAVEVELLHVDQTCRLWVKSLSRTFFGSFIGSESSKKTALQASLPPEELAAFEQVRMDIAAEIVRLKTQGTDRSWNCKGFLVGSFRIPAPSRRSVRDPKPEDDGIHLSSAQLASNFLRAKVTGLIDLDVEQTSLATVWSNSDWNGDVSVSPTGAIQRYGLKAVSILLTNRFRHEELPSLNPSRSL